MTQATPPTLTGQDIAEVQGAMRAVLAEALDGTDVTSTEYVVLRVLAARGPYPEPSALHDFLAGQQQLNLTHAGAVALVDGLAARGLLDAAAPTRITDEGEALYRRLTAETVAPVTARLFADLHPGDLATTRRVLAELAQRANGLSEHLRAERDRTS
jgi:DNA-binding MarR family transcriptional regulator